MERSEHDLAPSLERLTERLLRLGGLVEQAINDSVQALTERDSRLARQVIERDAAIDNVELEIDRICLGLLEQPRKTPEDLRFVTAAMKIAPDLERIADHAGNIAERALELNAEPPLPTIVDLPFMAQRAQAMVRGALDALVARDGTAARRVIAMDDRLDRRMEQLFETMLDLMTADPSTISRALRMTFVAKACERIGDQATNICEQVVFMTEDRVIKHLPWNDDAGSSPPA